MNKKPNIAVIAGGDSSEYLVSIKSSTNIFSAIDTKKFTPYQVQILGKEWNVITDAKQKHPIDKSNFSFFYKGEHIFFDYAYITIHGTPGEDGILQGYFDIQKIPYSTCNVHSSSLTFNKWFCSNYLKSFGIKTAKSIKISKGDFINTKEIVQSLGLPIFVKPNAGGSSFGITKVKSEKNLKGAIKKAWDENSEAIVEEYIEGTEYTCGLIKLSGKKIIFPVTEVRPKNEFFDYDAKYTPGACDEITPARLPENLLKKCQELSAKIYDLCQCKGIIRVDYILKDDIFYFLEVNTTPGMTATSFIPQQIKAMGLTLKEIISQLIEEQFQ